jgi:methylmalonyl-CoA/ethylmalonyl-CoA epimerase
VVVDSEPHVIFSHEDATLGPAGTDEWQAFVRDSEGNLVGLVEQRPQAATG